MNTFQVCPLCNGQEIVCKHPYIAGDVHQWTSSEMTYECRICKGKGIISTITGLPPDNINSETINTTSIIKEDPNGIKREIR